MKNSKYLKYAFGEIILVVIGILIALSINNWNTSRQQQKELKGYLEKIADNMQQDMALAEQYTIKRDSMTNLCRRAVIAMTEKELDVFVLFPAISIFIEYYFISNKSGFEALKTSGYIGKLRDSKIDSLLNMYYFNIEELEREETSYNTFIENMEVRWMTENSLKPILPYFDLSKAEVTDFEGFQKALLVNQDWFKSPSFEAIVIRGASESAPQAYYQALINIGNAFIEEVKRLE